MAKVVKVIELMSQSPESWKDAARGALNEATKHSGTFARFIPTNSPLKWTPKKLQTIGINAKITFDPERE